jgi:hypothetical protein
MITREAAGTITPMPGLNRRSFTKAFTAQLTALPVSLYGPAARHHERRSGQGSDQELARIPGKLEHLLREEM